MYKGIYLLLWVVCLAGCRKAKPDLDNPDEVEVCVDLPVSYNTMPAQFSREQAKFDPYYPERLYYTKTSYFSGLDMARHATIGQPFKQLISYNLRTNEFSVVLYSYSKPLADSLSKGIKADFGFHTFVPGPNDWILFVDNRRNICKIKKDGTVMRKIREMASGPSWTFVVGMQKNWSSPNPLPKSIRPFSNS